MGLLHLEAMILLRFFEYQAHKNQQIRLKDVFLKVFAFGTVFFSSALSDTSFETNSNGFFGKRNPEHQQIRFGN